MTVWTMTIMEAGTDNELDVYLNEENKIYIGIGEGTNDVNAQGICLNVDDARDLRNELDKLINFML